MRTISATRKYRLVKKADKKIPTRLQTCATLIGWAERWQLGFKTGICKISSMIGG
jgi:hypothetical protein